MKDTPRTRCHTSRRAGIACLLALFGVITPVAASGDLVVRAERLVTMAGPIVEDGVVVIRGGKIETVGAVDRIEVPEGVEVVEVRVAVPGLIDARSTVGLTGHLNYRHDQEQLDHSEAIQPELRATDAYDARERLVDWVRSFGITTVHTGHAPGELISGRTTIVKTRGETIDEAVVVEDAMVVATLGSGAKRGGASPPGTRSKAVAMLRQAFLDARAYAAERADGDVGSPSARDLRKEALVDVLEGRLPLLVEAERAHDIEAALRIADELDLRIVLSGASDAPVLLDRIAASGVPVIVHPQMARPFGDRRNVSFTTARALAERGVPIAFQSGYESYVPKTRVALLEAAVAVAYGLPFERALAALTIDAARILGIDGRVGSLEPGKDGDLALYDGDPFEYTSHCEGVVIDGVFLPSDPPR